MTFCHSILAVTMAAALMGSANAHVRMVEPAPLSPAPDTSPLDRSGSNFPCKKTSAGFIVNTTQDATVGQPFQLSFAGSANHNGGSCQLSLSKDDASALSSSSSFKVIYSIMGGCPGVSGVENSYQIKVPAEVPNGKYTMAWTWFNNIGNREMYMNCALLAVSGSKASSSDFRSLPDMAIYNIQGKDNGCKTIETKDVQFPNPGRYVETGQGAKLAPPACNGASGDTSGSGTAVIPAGGSGNNGQPASPAAGTSSMNNGLYTPRASATSSKAASMATLAPAASYMSSMHASSGITRATPSATSSYKAPSAAAHGFSSGVGQACSQDGALVCNSDGTQLGLCNFGRVQFMAVAPGTLCRNGAIAKLRPRAFLA